MVPVYQVAMVSCHLVVTAFYVVSIYPCHLCDCLSYHWLQNQSTTQLIGTAPLLLMILFPSFQSNSCSLQPNFYHPRVEEHNRPSLPFIFLELITYMKMKHKYERNNKCTKGKNIGFEELRQAKSYIARTEQKFQEHKKIHKRLLGLWIYISREVKNNQERQMKSRKTERRQSTAKVISNTKGSKSLEQNFEAKGQSKIILKIMLMKC